MNNTDCSARPRPVIFRCPCPSRSTDLRYSQGNSMKILEDMWMEGFENPNHPVTGSGSSMCLAIPNWTEVFASPIL